MIIGVDPGKSGGIAAVDSGGSLLAGMRTPLLKHGKRDVVDTAALNAWLPELGSVPSAVVIEQVSSRPGQGSTSGFALKVPVRWVTPVVWKRVIGIPAGSDKRASLDRARLEFGASQIWDVMANDGIAEAALIALWALRNR
jgi:hypothetical protein